MLGKTAGGLYWMFRYLERSENTARLLDAGFRIALTRSKTPEDEWNSVLTTAGVRDSFAEKVGDVNATNVIDFLLREKSNPSSILNIIENARNNARMVRTALTREVWEATNEGWMKTNAVLAKPVRERDFPSVLATIRQQSALVHGALYGTMLRNDIYDFARIGTFLERADNTARILDVKYYVLLPSISLVGSSLDNVQWETILRSVSAHRSYRWLNGANISPGGIAEFLILDRRMPRSLAFCYAKIAENLNFLAEEYEEQLPCHVMADNLLQRLKDSTIEAIMDEGLHEYIEDFIRHNNEVGVQVESDFRFTG